MLDRLNSVGDDGEKRPEGLDDPGADQPEAFGRADPVGAAGRDGSGVDRPAGSGSDGAGQTEASGEGSTVALDGLNEESTVPLEGLDDERTVPLEGLGEESTVALDGSGDEGTVPLEGVSGDETVALDGLRPDKSVELEEPRAGEAVVPDGHADKTVARPGLQADKASVPEGQADKTVALEGLRASEALAPDEHADKTVAIEGPRADKTVASEGRADETVAIAGLGADRTVALQGLGADEAVQLEGPGGDGVGRTPGSDADQPARPEDGGAGQPAGQGGLGGLGSLAGLGGQGADRTPSSGDGWERLKGRKATKSGQAAERLKGWGDEHPVARRRLLIAVPSVVGLALVTGAVKAAEPKPKPKPAKNVRAVARPRPVQPVEKTAVHTLPVQHKPIFTLDDYRRMTGAPPFPADAIALTIDDGPHPVWTPKILRLLDKYHVPALFCMIGNQVLGHEAVAQTVTKAGHQLANHTWSHPTSLAARSGDQVRKEIERAQAKIQSTTGYVPKLFRSPGGDWSPTVLQETAKAGLIPLDWDNDPRDWSRPGIPHIKSKLLAARPGQILLCHDGGGDRSQTYAALSAVLPALTARGLRFVAL